MLERVLQATALYWRGLLLLEDVLFGFVLQTRSDKNDKKETVPYLAQARRLGDIAAPRRFADVMKAAKNYISVVCDAAGVSRKPFWVEGVIDESTEAAKPDDKEGSIQLTLPESGAGGPTGDSSPARR